jgi:hypothetical protein
MTDSVIGALGASPGLDGVDTGGSWEWPRTSAGDVEEAEAAALPCPPRSVSTRGHRPR